MEKSEIVSMQEWAELYKVAIEFYTLKCWEWIYDSDLFGVKNPETGEIGYCSIMGNLKEVFALNVYLGSEGLKTYQDIYEMQSKVEQGEEELNPGLIFKDLRCLMASFEDRNAIEEEDIEIITKLGLKFRGKKAWPCFRSYRPCKVPWFLTSSEARCLTIVLKEVVTMALRIKENSDVLNPPLSGQYLVRVFENGHWIDTWQFPEPIAEKRLDPEINEIALAKIKHERFSQHGIWEADCTLVPVVVREGERPFYPVCFSILDDQSMALSFESMLSEELKRLVPEKFLQTIQKVHYLPKTVLVKSKETYDLLEPIAKALKITIKRVETLPSVEYFISGMKDFLIKKGVSLH